MLLCTDGCFKLTNLDVVLLTVGLLFEDLNSNTHSLGFHEVLYGLFRSESEGSFNQLFDSLFEAVESITGWDIASAAVQLHGDFAEGLERSRLLMLPSTVRRGVCVVFTIVKAWKHKSFFVTGDGVTAFRC